MNVIDSQALSVQVEGAATHTLAVNVVWDAHCTVGEGAVTLDSAVTHLLQLLPHVCAPSPAQQTERPHISSSSQSYHPDRSAWEGQMRTCLEELSTEPGFLCEGAVDGLPNISAAAIQVCRLRPYP